ncbi:MAG: glycosyltransferase family 4 protein [Chlamydiota bacterium]
MKLLFLNHNIRGQGTYARCYNLASQLARRGHQCVLACVSADPRGRFGRTHERGVEIVTAPTRWGGLYQGGGWGLLDILTRLGCLSLRRYDLVYAFDHRPNVALPAFVEKYAGRVPLIADWADWWCRGGHTSVARISRLQYGVELFLEEGTKRVSDGVTVICTALKERALGLGIPPERLLHLPSGADVENILPMDKGNMRSRHGIPRGGAIVGYISASLIDADMLLNAMAKVFAMRSNCRLLFLGPDSGWHRDMAVGLGIDDRIIWAGVQPYSRIAEFIACADVMALPMRDNLINRGRWPNRIGENMAAGRATVACAVGDVRTLFTEEKIGVLTEPDEDSFATHVCALLDNPRLAEELGNHAREVGERACSWEQMTARFCSFLGRLPETRGMRV